MNHPERTGTAGIGLIKQFEGLSLSKYRDAVGLWTIGYGHLIGQSERFERQLSHAEGLRWAADSGQGIVWRSRV